MHTDGTARTQAEGGVHTQYSGLRRNQPGARWVPGVQPPELRGLTVCCAHRLGSGRRVAEALANSGRRRHVKPLKPCAHEGLRAHSALGMARCGCCLWRLHVTKELVTRASCGP